MTPFRSTPTRIQPYFGYRNRSRLKLTARALRSGKPGFEPASRIRAFRTMMAQFASREVAGLAVRLTVEAEGTMLLDHEVVTDGEGYAHFDCALTPEWDLPEHPRWESVTLSWTNEQGPQAVEAHVLAPGRDGRLAVISDMDDTVIETGITGGPRAIARNWHRVLAQLPDERTAVSGADVFYGALGGGDVLPPGEMRAGKSVSATRRPFFYVSSSPWNLFSYLVAFMRTKGLPLGPLLLRDWGLNRETFGSSSHGAHKTDAIRSILEMYPDTRFALIGDDTQGDLPAFAQMVESFPGHVAAVFLRKAASEDFSPEETAGKSAIEAAGVPLWIGESYELGEDFLSELGFTPGGETEQIVRTVDKEPTEADLAAQRSGQENPA